MWLLLIILGAITYFLVKRSVAPITRTPVWIIWLVMMMPALVWTIWYEFVGQDQPMPLLLVVAPLIICFTVYVWLIRLGQPTTSDKNIKENSAIVDSQDTEKSTEESQKLRPITINEEKSLRDCFPWAVYYLQNLDYRPQAILCRGKLRTAPEEAYKSIKKNIEQVFGDRFLVLFQEGLSGGPFFALVPNPWAKSDKKETEKPLTRPFFALGLLLVTLLTTTFVGAEIAGVSREMMEANSRVLLQGIPYSLGLIAILGLHELSHYFTAVRYKIATTLPYFIPIPFFLGTFGAFIQMKSPVPNRKALFDVAVAGPLGGFIITIPLLLWGLSLSEVVDLPLNEASTLLNFQALDPRFSFLFAVLAKLVLGSSFLVGKAVHLHPLAVSGYVGLIVTALNLMPVGQLDGGHIIHAMYGQRTAIIVGQLTRIFMLVLAMIRPEFLIWAILLFLMPVSDQPALNDVTELDNKRDLLGLFSLILLLSILLPLPGAIANWLSI
ncbi:site-2 protease family protein [Crocosphaera sp. XPORK-15E]|uniref:site-2 protease family protein n=1 Tax=Crocosphaera sp. XPORK-15E TaxID=3110247 RepID=UPI002B1FBDF4|nr:site-2 protease family protein [Crocosphaera sp. XPORK-15E]MEA5535115.1 site-2 protease family protein [Crocosphaera sp. XPORK-15E]